MKKRHTKKTNYLEVTLAVPGQKKAPHYKIPYSEEVFEKLQGYLLGLENLKRESSGKSIPWNILAKERIARYSKAGIALRGARYREGLSQKELAKRSAISQDNISKMENGKRPIGEKVAKRLAQILKINYSILLTSED